MSKEIIVNKGKQTRIAIVENGELAELFIENQEHERTIGNIFLGRIRRVMPSIQAAFVDIGQKQDAFLHFSDLIDNVESWLDYAKTDQAEIGSFKGDYTTKPAGKKRRRPTGQRHGGSDQQGKDRRRQGRGGQPSRRESGGDNEREQEGPQFDPASILVKDQPILVKISKEPIANKGSRVTTDISLAGRFLVLVPMANYVAVSKKIMSFKERRRLRALARSLLPEGFGVIVRTVAEGRSAKALDTDLNLLVDKWKRIEGKLKNNPKPPAVIHEDVNMVSSIMRDLFTEDYDRILIDDQKLYRNIRGYVQAIAPDMVEDVKLEENAESVFQKVGIKAAVEEAFDERVNMPSGGYLFFEQTEAMHVVDVNSGRAGRGMSQEDSSLKVNLEAAKIICKQVRLRDLGGIIVVDFIDMRHESNRRKLYETLKKEFRADRAVTKVLPMSDFGLIQITRQRLRPSITKTFSLPDEQSSASAADPRQRRGGVRDRTVAPSHLRVEPEDLLRKIEDWLASYRDAGKSARVRLKVHPFTASFLSGKFPSRTFRWRLRFGVRVQIDSDASVDPMSFRFFDGSSGKEISRLSNRTDRNARRNPQSGQKASEGQEKRDETSGSNNRGRSRSGSGRSGSGRSGGTRSEGRSDGGRQRGRGDSGRSGRDARSGGDDRSKRSDAGAQETSRGRGRSESPRSDSSRSSGGRSGAGRSERDSRSEKDTRRGSERRGSSDARRGSDSRRSAGRNQQTGADGRPHRGGEHAQEAPTRSGQEANGKGASTPGKGEAKEITRGEVAPRQTQPGAPAPVGSPKTAQKEVKPTESPAREKAASESKPPSQPLPSESTSAELPKSNRFVKIDLTSGS